MKTLEINERFAEYFNELDYGQTCQLEKSMKADLTSEPILWWHNPIRDCDEILDGHHRYAIAKRCGLDLQMHEKHFDNEDAALLFIIRHQTTRRNVEDRERIVRLAVDLEIRLGSGKTQAVKDVAQRVGLAESTIWRDVRPLNPVEAFKKAKQSLENKLTVAKTKAADKLRVQAQREELDENATMAQWEAIEEIITADFETEFAELESLGQVAQQAVEDNPGLKNTGKRPTKKSTKDRAARRNTFKKALSLIAKLRNDAFYFWDQNGCGDVGIEDIKAALKVFVASVEDAQAGDIRAATKRKFGKK
jgi:ParB-like chromosome segregation protein Spo0J